MIKLIEKIEGEAKLHFRFDNAKISHVDIEFMSTRNISEKILQGKPALDALVINPRVCGICGHAHLLATVQALEECYDTLELSPKAQTLREITLNFELIQNHFKWIYLTIFPLLGEKQHILKATYPSQIMSQAIATVAGQYPHNSYALVGGVVSEVTHMDIIKLHHYLDETIQFFETHLVRGFSEELLVCNDISNLLNKEGDLPSLLKRMIQQGWEEYGKSYDQFIAFGENSYFQRGKSNKTRRTESIPLKYVEEQLTTDGYAKSVTYKGKHYEVGPLARAMINKTPLIKDAHRRYGDSIFSRILARACETAQLLIHTKKLIDTLDLSQPSYIQPHTPIEEITATGESAVEAARGSLIHKVTLKQGIIQHYDIITPTQWNLSGGTPKQLGVSQKAMIGMESAEMAELVFKSFDVCSVCTTH